MGGFFAKMFERMMGKKQILMLIVGLDGAGKTTMLYKLKLGHVLSGMPQIGFNVETFEYKKNISFTVLPWIVGGQDKIRPLLKHYYKNTQGIVFIIDSNDHQRISVLSNQEKELLCSGFIYEKHHQYIPTDIVNLCKSYFGVNKHDCQWSDRIHLQCEECTRKEANAQSELHLMAQEEELKDAVILILANKQDLPYAMCVDEMKKRLLLNQINQQWYIQPTILTTGDGLYEGLVWMENAIKRKMNKKK